MARSILVRSRVCRVLNFDALTEEVIGLMAEVSGTTGNYPKLFDDLRPEVTCLRSLEADAACERNCKIA